MSNEPEILFERIGRAGVITLNRPQALNAVTDHMVRAVADALDNWEADDTVKRVIIRANGDRAFSAGGDIRHLYECGLAGDYDYDFFAREYALNARIAAFPKPYIAFVNGIAMGGGVGVSFHGSHVVGGERLSFAMPECGIGFFPDVGGSYLLSRLPGSVGLFLGLTGERVGQGDALALGLVSHACGTGSLDTLFDTLSQTDDVGAALAPFKKPNVPVKLTERRALIDIAFSAPTLQEILLRLESMAHDESNNGRFAEKTLETLRTKCPVSLHIAFRQIRAGATLSMPDCMRMEYRILRRLLPLPHFYEGIRAAIIDKDGAPRWQPASVEEVDEAQVDRFFETLGEKELVL